MGFLGVWNASFLGYATRALLPYSQALHKFAPHIQQVDMESNGKRVGKLFIHSHRAGKSNIFEIVLSIDFVSALNGTPLDFEAGPINFGEPGTNGQHSFYQLVHQVFDGQLYSAGDYSCTRGDAVT